MGSPSTYIERISFGLDDVHRATARAEARAAAIAKAERLALQAALSVGASSVHLTSAAEPPREHSEADIFVPAEPRQWGPPLIIEPGTIEIGEEVRATFVVVR